jgi:protoporphyrinogen oxidase
VVLEFLARVESDMLRIERSTEVHFLNRYFEWPLTPRDLVRMPIPMAVRSLIDLLRRSPGGDSSSFPDYIRSRYGETLYQTFFAPYTTKFLRWDVNDIHSDWASTGINRTVVDSRIKSSSSLDLIRNTLLPSKVKTEFLYPNEGGFGGFYERLLRLCQANSGFTLSLSDAPTQISRTDAGLDVTLKSGSGFSCGNLLWTGNLNDLAALAGIPVSMPYLNTIFFNVVCRSEGALHQRSQWIYVSSGKTLTSRITSMKEFAPYTCPPDYYNFVCEVTDSQKNPVYFAVAEKCKDTVLNELCEMHFLKANKYVEAIHTNAVVDTYPIYHRGYLKQFGQTAADVRRFSPRITLVGRSGAFWYNNSDHSIRFALETARRLVNGQAGEFDYRGYFGGGQSRSTSPTGVAD